MQNTDVAPNTNNDDTTSKQDNSRSKHKSFDTREELLKAVDTFILGQQNATNTSSVFEEIYGNISDWNVSYIQDFSHLFDALTRNNKHRNFVTSMKIYHDGMIVLLLTCPLCLMVLDHSVVIYQNGMYLE